MDIERHRLYLLFFFFINLANFCCLAHHPDAGEKKLPKIVMEYYASWERQLFDHNKIDYRHLTHIAHAFTKPDSDGHLIVDEGYIYPELNQEAHRHNVKMIMSIGGWGNCEGFPPMASSRSARERFIAQVVSFCKENGYDGVDIDWEYVSNPEESENFVLFIEELSDALKGFDPPLELSMAAPSGHFWGQWFNYEELIDEFDYISFMTYDYHGPWSDHSGHNAPLYSCHDDPCGSMNDTFSYARKRNVPKEKLLLGLPFYGRAFDCGGLQRPFEDSRYLNYREILKFVRTGWQYIWDGCAEVPYLRNPQGTAIICYDDERSVSVKCRFIEEKQAAGVIIWELSGDYVQNKSVLLDIIGKEFK